MIDKNKTKQLKAAKHKIRILITVCTALLLLSVSYIMDAYGVWRNIFTFSRIASVYEESGGYPLSVTVFDVGNANCVLVRFEDHCILIDSGMQKLQNNIADKLRSENIDKIDLAVLSCPDERYIGSMCEVAETVRIDRFVTCGCNNAKTPQEYDDLLNILDTKNTPVEYAVSGDEISFGEMTLRIISPDKTDEKKSDNSLAVRLTYGEFGMLFMGNTSKKARDDLISRSENISCDVILIACQGRANSVTDAFLRAADPDDAVISVEQTDYIPDDKVIRRIIDYGCNLYRTDYSGNIVIESDGSEYKIITQFK